MGRTRIDHGARGPGRLRRFVFQLPLLLEPILGQAMERMVTRALGVRWLVLETVGHRSGHPHRVVLDIVGCDQPRGVYYVQPAYGRQCDWVRNVTVHPDVRVRVSGQWHGARARDACGREGTEIVLRFLRAHPWYAWMVVWFVGYVDRLDRPDDELRRDLASTPVFAIEVVPDAGLTQY